MTIKSFRTQKGWIFVFISVFRYIFLSNNNRAEHSPTPTQIKNFIQCTYWILQQAITAHIFLQRDNISSVFFKILIQVYAKQCFHIVPDVWHTAAIHVIGPASLQYKTRRVYARIRTESTMCPTYYHTTHSAPHCAITMAPRHRRLASRNINFFIYNLIENYLINW